jgi:DNA-binding NarL/FixJ family response regulator|tara:strand:- start:925 stop:1578 length:654 start_codon:yes stop_codon:yes gene_type:complete
MQPLLRTLHQEALKLLVVEDHPVYLEGLSYILKKLGDHLVLTCVNSTSDAIKLLEWNSDFDLVLLDLFLPDGGGLSVLRFISFKKIFIPAVILSASKESKDVQRSLIAGASGFISKASASDEILQAIDTILKGEHFWPDFYSPLSNAEGLNAPSLTRRQLEVLALVAEGLPNKRICQILNVSEHTVKSYMKCLFSALNVHNRTECARVAIELGLIDS